MLDGLELKIRIYYTIGYGKSTERAKCDELFQPVTESPTGTLHHESAIWFLKSSLW